MKPPIVSITKYGSIFNTWLEYRWEQIQHLRGVMHETRFSFFVVVITLAALLLNDQGREIAVSAGDSASDIFLYPAATLWLATQVWYWARIILSAKQSRVEGQSDAVADVFPRLLAAVTCSIPTVALIAALVDGQAGKHAWWVLAVLVLSSSLFLVFIVFRRKIDNSVREILGKGDNPDPDTSPIFVWLSLCIAVLSTLIAWLAPLQLGAFFGVVPILMLGLASVVTFGSSFVYLTRKSAFPTVTFLVFSTVILSSCAPYYIRQGEPYDIDLRPTLSDEFGRWKHLQDNENPGDEPKTAIVVAASGGGITAAYWTSTLLAHFQELDPKFASRLFLISSVSGGSVGATVFTQALKCDLSADAKRKKIAGVLGGDLLAPVLGTALFSDMFFWTPGFSVFAHIELKPKDRAVVFENKLEHMWRDHFSEKCAGLDQSFLKQRSFDNKWQPILMLNSAHQETGRPVIQSQVRLSDAGKARPFETAIDLFSVTKHDLRLSTAALNSARFPLVSPAGQIRPEPGEPPLNLGRLIDGGYFENDGAFTLMQTLSGLKGQLDNIRVVVIQISIDSPLPFEPNNKTEHPEFIADLVARAPHTANDLLAPAYGFFVSSASHKEDARDRLRSWTMARGEKKGIYVHFRALIPKEGHGENPPAKPPLGWLLSRGSQDQLRDRTLCLDRNFKEWEKLAPALGVGVDTLESCGVSKPDFKENILGVLRP